MCDSWMTFPCIATLILALPVILLSIHTYSKFIYFIKNIWFSKQTSYYGSLNIHKICYTSKETSNNPSNTNITHNNINIQYYYYYPCTGFINGQQILTILSIVSSMVLTSNNMFMCQLTAVLFIIYLFIYESWRMNVVIFIFHLKTISIFSFGALEFVERYLFLRTYCGVVGLLFFAVLSSHLFLQYYQFVYFCSIIKSFILVVLLRTFIFAYISGPSFLGTTLLGIFYGALLVLVYGAAGGIYFGTLLGIFYAAPGSTLLVLFYGASGGIYFHTLLNLFLHNIRYIYCGTLLVLVYGALLGIFYGAAGGTYLATLLVLFWYISGYIYGASGGRIVKHIYFCTDILKSFIFYSIIRSFIFWQYSQYVSHYGNGLDGLVLILKCLVQELGLFLELKNFSFLNHEWILKFNN